MSITSNGLNFEISVFNFNNAYVEGTLELNYFRIPSKSENLLQDQKQEVSNFLIASSRYKRWQQL